MDKIREAWLCELATLFNKTTKIYSGWKISLSLDKPNVPEGSIRNLKHLVKEVEWQPIETAPKEKAIYGYWNNIDEWVQVIFYYPNEPLALGYTHWQPLPVPPKKI